MERALSFLIITSVIWLLRFCHCYRFSQEGRMHLLVWILELNNSWCVLGLSGDNIHLQSTRMPVGVLPLRFSSENQQRFPCWHHPVHLLEHKSLWEGMREGHSPLKTLHGAGAASEPPWEPQPCILSMPSSPLLLGMDSAVSQADKLGTLWACCRLKQSD